MVHIKGSSDHTLTMLTDLAGGKDSKDLHGTVLASVWSVTSQQVQHGRSSATELGEQTSCAYSFEGPDL